MSETFIQGWWKQMLESGFVGGVFLHPWTVYWGQACPRGSRCHCEPTSLCLWRHSLLPWLWLVTWGAQTHMCFFRTRSQLSLFTAGLLCAFSVHTVWWEFHLLCGNLQNANPLGNREQNWCFPSSPGLTGGWQRWAPNLRWRNSRTDLYLALSPQGQSWSRPCIGNFHTSVWLFLQKQT